MNAERDRDRLLEDALKHQLGAGGAMPATDSCLDAEAVAAWMDGGLDPQAAAMAEAHASNCVRCQALLGTMARATPAVAVTKAQGARLWRWWLAPLAASAAAMTVWMVVPQDRLAAPPEAPAIESPALEPSLAKSGAAPPATPPPPAVAAPATANRSNVGRDRADAPARRAQPESKREVEQFEARERPAETAKLADTAVAGRIAEVAPAPVSSAPAGAMAQPAMAVAEEQSMARSAPSPNVIWRVGRAGLVQLATDGQRFVRVPFPETVDLTAVTATDERRAVVTAADGRAFETADGGRTWQRRPS